ncbi:hypothetical protein [Sphingobium aquiterrae]|uniref:hypothetical protein n=1 Tax=Sphingobium aquiterrae TaxID=2038656 RepID=UPI00301B35B3
MNDPNVGGGCILYRCGPTRFSLAVRDRAGDDRVKVNNLFNERPVTNIGPSSKTPFADIGKATSANFDQYHYQTGRAFTGDITLKF